MGADSNLKCSICQQAKFVSQRTFNPNRNTMNLKFNFVTRRWFGSAMLSLGLAALSACGGGEKEAPTSDSHLYRSLQLLRVGMTLGDAENIIGRSPDQWSERSVVWTEGNERLIFLTVTGQSDERISYIQWTWGAGKSATYTFRGANGVMPELTVVND
jgi:hypothetical protein